MAILLSFTSQTVSSSGISHSLEVIFRSSRAGLFSPFDHIVAISVALQVSDSCDTRGGRSSARSQEPPSPPRRERGGQLTGRFKMETFEAWIVAKSSLIKANLQSDCTPK